jgi:two-component system, NarL family, sensor histidine kinase DesK
MFRADDDRHLYLLHSAGILLMVYVVAVLTVYNETNNFVQWDDRIRWTLPLILMFLISYTAEQALAYRGQLMLAERLLWLDAALIAGLAIGMQEPDFLLSFIAFWLASTPKHYSLRTCNWLALAAWLLFILSYVLFSDEGTADLLILAALSAPVFLFVLSTAYTSVNLRRQRQQAVALNAELHAMQLQLAQASRTNERLRIARDLHDLLGHQMTALILNLEIATHKNSGDSVTYVERALALAKMLLGDLRNAVSDMRDNPALDFDSALADLTTNVPALQVRIERSQGFAVHDSRIAEALLRCIQEALTNTLRHANAKKCVITLHEHGNDLMLEVCDDGGAPPHIKPGNGLRGMQERVAALAGTLQWRGGDGFTLQVSLPLPAAEA